MNSTRATLLLLCLVASGPALATGQQPMVSNPVQTAQEIAPAPAQGESSFVLMQHFSGHWQNVSGDVETTLSLYPNGLFRQRVVAARGEHAALPSGSSANWEIRKRQYMRGNWQISGAREHGTIGLMSPDGQVQQLEYRVEGSPEAPNWHIYRFNDRLYYRR